MFTPRAIKRQLAMFPSENKLQQTADPVKRKWWQENETRFRKYRIIRTTSAPSQMACFPCWFHLQPSSCFFDYLITWIRWSFWTQPVTWWFKPRSANIHFQPIRLLIHCQLDTYIMTITNRCVYYRFLFTLVKPIWAVDTGQVYCCYTLLRCCTLA